MNSNDTPKREVDVDKIASTNPRINAAFKEWRRKMDRLERLGLIPDRAQPLPIGRGESAPAICPRRVAVQLRRNPRAQQVKMRQRIARSNIVSSAAINAP